MDTSFLEFVLFSETRFMEYSLRTYDHRIYDHRTYDHRTYDHRTYDHRTYDHRTYDHRTYDHRTYDHRTYDHRTYDHFFNMYPVLVTKIRRDVVSGELPSDLVMDRECTEKLLAQATFILRLIFMREISHLLTRFSKSSQKFDVLPFHGMLYYEKVIRQLSVAMDYFKRAEIPPAEILNGTVSHK